MSTIQDKAQRLFKFISRVYAIDLPVNRDVTKYGAEIWWQADISPSSQCEIKKFDEDNIDSESIKNTEKSTEEVWLSVNKRSYDKPPNLPPILEDWIDLSSNPTIMPKPKASILKIDFFDSDSRRVRTFKNYVDSFKKWKESEPIEKPQLPKILIGWIEEDISDEKLPIYKKEFEEKFEDNKDRIVALHDYIEGPWKSWSERILPFYKANFLYDQLFSLYQRLSVEGDRIEIIWGHLFLSWNHSNNNTIYHPLLITPMNLHFDPMRRNLSLIPSQTIATKLDLDCLMNLDYYSKDELTKYSSRINSGEAPVDAWNNNQMRGLASTITGYLSDKSAEKTNLYSNDPLSKPSIYSYPTIYNAPIIFVRERTRRFWVDDAEKVATAISEGADIPPFIRSLIADPHTKELPNPEDYVDSPTIDEDEGEHLLPLPYNDQQEEIVKKLKSHFGVLVQGPPGTGKSHTIANVVSSLLARGERVLVTSQTENALRVLRDFIPQQIRSLCVSHLGSDTESKKQLNEAVNAIGKNLSEKDSSEVEQKIKRLKKELRSIREEQAKLKNQIRDWVELDFCTMNIDGKTINAYNAAKECSENEENHSWFPDNLAPETAPPLSEKELQEMCSLIKEVSPQDRKSCLQYLPNFKNLLLPEDISKKFTELKMLSNNSVETEKLRAEWGANLVQANRNEIEEAISLLEKALLEMQKIEKPWQFKILEFISEEKAQNDFWQNFIKKCDAYRNSAWQTFQLIQGYEITVESISPELDIFAALEELDNCIKKNRQPDSFLGKLKLSKAAKTIFNAIKIDGHNIRTPERINIAKAYFTYKANLKKIDIIWGKNINTVNGELLDLTKPMPLAEVDEKIKYANCPIEWKNKYFEKIRKVLVNLGCQKHIYHKQENLKEYLKVLYGQTAEIDKNKLEESFIEYHNFLLHEAKKEGVHDLWAQFADAVRNRSFEKYEQTYNELIRLLNIRKKVEQLEYLSNKLKSFVPNWYNMLEKKATDSGQQALEKDWAIAWRWKRLDQWLKNLHNRESVDSLQNRLERARRRENEQIEHLVISRTWQRQLANVKDYQFRALVAWAEAMRKYGKTGGKYAQKWLATASNAMKDAVGVVPAWIMPLHRVIQSFPAKQGIFDVIIVDEASQCDLRALPVLFRAKKVLIVGDPEQISPSSVGIDRNKVFELNREFLYDIPHADVTFLIDNSLYDISKAIPRMDRTLLTEHFRCIPQIIEFNNQLCPTYAGKLEPLRQANPEEMLEPSISTVFVETGFKDNNNINKPEAEALVNMLVKCCKDNRYSKGGKNNRKRTMGVISLLGEKQAKYISELISQSLDETEIAERRIICGDAYAFQGDERDVMFLSLVIGTNSKFSALVKDSDRQRFNVATSRARDQVFLFHSVKLEDIKNPACVRYKLLNWYLNSPIAEMEAGIETLRRKADSTFEIEVGERIIKKGYKVIPQYRPFTNDFNYRIDLVIQGERNRVAVECDGDRFHGPEQWEYDQRREAQLRRAGWKFWRISGSAFYRDKDKSMESLWQFLESEGIKAFAFKKSNSTNSETVNKEAPDSSQEDMSVVSEMKKNEISLSIKSKNSKIKVKSRQNHTNLVDAIQSTRVPNDWRVWFKISHWAKETGLLKSSSRAFAYQIGKKLKYGWEIHPKHKIRMEKLWKFAIKKGFTLKTK